MKPIYTIFLSIAIALLAMLLMLSLMLAGLSSTKERQLYLFEKLSLERKAVFRADLVVKNRDIQSPELGSALFDSEKRRVLRNEIDPVLLQEESAVGENCIVLDRIVLVNGLLQKLGVKTCE